MLGSKMKLGAMKSLAVAAASVLIAVSAPANAAVVGMNANLAGPGFLTSANFTSSDHFDLPTITATEFIFNDPNVRFGSWVDLVITVTRSLADTGPQSVSVDKIMTNLTNFSWLSVEHVLGNGTAGGFVESGEADGLYFLTSPAPMNTTSDFVYLTTDELVEPEKVRFSGGVVGVGATSNYWLGVHIPDSKFVPISSVPLETATFTVRQHVVSEPGVGLLAAMGLLGTLAIRRRKAA